MDEWILTNKTDIVDKYKALKVSSRRLSLHAPLIRRPLYSTTNSSLCLRWTWDLPLNTITECPVPLSDYHHHHSWAMIVNVADRFLITGIFIFSVDYRTPVPHLTVAIYLLSLTCPRHLIWPTLPQDHFPNHLVLPPLPYTPPPLASPKPHLHAFP